MPTPWDETRHRWRGCLLGIPAATVGLPRARWHNVQRVLQAVLWFDQKGEGCWAGGAAIAEEADLSRTTLGRAKRDAFDLGLLSVERRDNPGPYGGRLPDRVRVDLEQLAEYIDEEPEAESSIDAADRPTASPRRKSVEPPGYPLRSDDSRRRLAMERKGQPLCPTSSTTPRAQAAPARSHAEEPAAQDAEPTVQLGAYLKDQTQEPTHNKQPPPPGAAAATAWTVVEGELFQLGLNQAAAACRDARDAGLSPAEVHALADHWRPRREAWGVHTHVVLRRRLQRAKPGQPPDEGWPNYDRDAPAAAARRADERTATLRRAHREKRLAKARALIEPLTPDQRARLGVEARRRRPELAKRPMDGRRVFEEGVAPLLEEWGAQGLGRWLRDAAP